MLQDALGIILRTFYSLCYTEAQTIYNGPEEFVLNLVLLQPSPPAPHFRAIDTTCNEVSIQFNDILKALQNLILVVSYVRLLYHL